MKVKETFKTIGKESEKIGNTLFTGEGAEVKIITKEPEPVAVRDYVSSKGYSGIVNWDGENPTVGGVKLKPLEVKNGIAYVSKDDVDSVLSNMEKGAGITGAQKMRDEKYGAIEKDALNTVVNRKPFSYDVENDVVYQAYKKQYEREAEHALRRILNENNTSVTGASGAVLSEAMAAQNEELQKITDAIPELYEAAYKRYTDEADMSNKTFKTINEVANDYYDRVYKADSDTIKRIADSGKAEREERQREIDNERDTENDMYENALKQIEILYRGDKLESDITKSEVNAEKTALDNALTRGFFVESDETAIPWLVKYRGTNGGYTLSPAVALINYEYSSAKARENGKIHAKLGR